MCVYLGISNTTRLRTTTVLNIAAASSETRWNKELVVRMSPLHNSFGLLSLLHYPKRYSGVSFRSLLWQKDTFLITTTSCQACFDTRAQVFSSRCLQCHCWKKRWKSCYMLTWTEELRFASTDPPKSLCWPMERGWEINTEGEDRSSVEVTHDSGNSIWIQPHGLFFSLLTTYSRVEEKKVTKKELDSKWKHHALKMIWNFNGILFVRPIKMILWFMEEILLGLVAINEIVLDVRQMEIIL